MNSFGRLFRLSIFGESHGQCVGVVIDGCPPGIEISADGMQSDLERRKGGGRGATARVEDDIPEILSGVFNGLSTGAPILIIFKNRDKDSSSYEAIKRTPRPGHADFTAFKKSGGFNDYRGGGHFSGRLTAPLVAAGHIAKTVIRPVLVDAFLREAGGSQDVNKNVEDALIRGDSIGGIVECVVREPTVGLGEPFFDSVESLISHAIFSIPAVKGIEFGSGFSSARMRGSEYNDEIIDSAGRTATNHCGGINGGITNGNDLIFRIAVKPPSSIPRKQKTIDMNDGRQTDIAVRGRHDACIALRMPVIVEAVTAVVLADLMLVEQKIERSMHSAKLRRS